MKKKSPKKIIESIENPHLESVYIKFPGEEMKNISAEKRNAKFAIQDEEKYNEIVMKYIKKKQSDAISFERGRHTEIHTHPSKENYGMVALPSGGDIERFLKKSSIRTMIIAQTNSITGEVQGYTVLRKKRDIVYKGKPPIGATWQKKSEDAKNYEKNAWFTSYNSKNKANPKDELKKLAQKYNFQYRWIPSQGYKLSDEKHKSGWRFIKKNHLEKIVTIISIFTGLFFISPSLTGNTVMNLDTTTTNIFGTIILLANILIITFIWIRNKNETQRNL